MMRPGETKRGQRVQHDTSKARGVVLDVYDKRGDKGTPVEYANVRFDNGGGTREHPTFVLSRI